MEYTFIHMVDNDLTTYRCNQLQNSSYFFRLNLRIIWYWEHISKFWCWGKCYPLDQLREHEAKIQITHAEHYWESDNLFSNKYYQTMHIDNQSIQTHSFDKICKRTRQIIRYRGTAILRQLQIKYNSLMKTQFGLTSPYWKDAEIHVLRFHWFWEYNISLSYWALDRIWRISSGKMFVRVSMLKANTGHVCLFAICTL